MSIMEHLLDFALIGDCANAHYVLMHLCSRAKDDLDRREAMGQRFVIDMVFRPL